MKKYSNFISASLLAMSSMGVGVVSVILDFWRNGILPEAITTPIPVFIILGVICLSGTISGIYNFLKKDENDK